MDKIGRSARFVTLRNCNKYNAYMTLAELIQQLRSLNDELTIYAEASPQWQPASKAVARLNLDNTTQPINVDGVQLEYLLEVFLAKEVIEGWSEWHGGQTPSVEQMCEAVIYYATYDAYLPSANLMAERLQTTVRGRCRLSTVY